MRLSKAKVGKTLKYNVIFYDLWPANEAGPILSRTRSQLETCTNRVKVQSRRMRTCGAVCVADVRCRATPQGTAMQRAASGVKERVANLTLIEMTTRRATSVGDVGLVGLTSLPAAVVVVIQVRCGDGGHLPRRGPSRPAAGPLDVDRVQAVHHPPQFHLVTPTPVDVHPPPAAVRHVTSRSRTGWRQTVVRRRLFSAV